MITPGLINLLEAIINSLTAHYSYAKACEVSAKTN